MVPASVETQGARAKFISRRLALAVGFCVSIGALSDPATENSSSERVSPPTALTLTVETTGSNTSGLFSTVIIMD